MKKPAAGGEKRTSHFTIAAAAMLLFFTVAACGPKPRPGAPERVKQPRWSQEKARAAIESLADEYRTKGDAFWDERTYVWAGTWIWPETIGINARHIDLLKKMFYEGDDATREIVLQVIMMNIPARKLDKTGGSFLVDLVRFDTELKERRSNTTPPTPYEDIIEDYEPVIR